jgi:RNase H-fold protein (predicted Holliday junction resolvase)
LEETYRIKLHDPDFTAHLKNRFAKMGCSQAKGHDRSVIDGVKKMFILENWLKDNAVKLQNYLILQKDFR